MSKSICRLALLAGFLSVLELDKTATARPFHLERANADLLYFMQIISLLQDENVKVQLKYNPSMLKSFREKLINYYDLADNGYSKVNNPKQTADISESRAMLRYHLGLFANDLGVKQPAEFAQKNFNEAISFYTQAIWANPKFATAYQRRAQAFRQIGKTELAEADEKQFNLLSK